MILLEILEEEEEEYYQVQNLIIMQIYFVSVKVLVVDLHYKHLIVLFVVHQIHVKMHLYWKHRILPQQFP